MQNRDGLNIMNCDLIHSSWLQHIAKEVCAVVGVKLMSTVSRKAAMIVWGTESLLVGGSIDSNQLKSTPVV